MRKLFRPSWLAVILLGCRLALGGDAKPTAPAGPTGIVHCCGYVVISTQTTSRLIAVDDVSAADLGIARMREGGEGRDAEDGAPLNGALSGLESGAVGVPSFTPPPPIRLPRREEGDEDSPLGAGLAPAREEDPFRSWGWLSRDIGRAERSAEEAAALDRRRTAHDRWLSLGLDNAGLGGRRDPRALPSFDDTE